MRDAAFAVFLPHVFEHFAATRFAKINVDIRWRDTVGIQKPLEKQSVLEWIDISDPKNVSNHRTSGRAASGSYGNALLFGEMNKIPNDQQITDKTGFFQNTQLILESTLQLWIACRAFAVPRAQALEAKLAQISFPRFTSRYWILRIFRAPKLKIETATFADDQSVFDRAGEIVEDLPHLGR